MLNLEEMTKIVHPIIVFLMFRIDWRKLLPIGAIITITFALLQTKMLPYQLMTRNSSLPNTNHFDANLKSQITPLIRDKQSEAIKVEPSALLNTSGQLVQSIAVVQEKAKVTQRRNQMNVVKPNISMKPSPPFSFTASERRHERYLRDIKILSPHEALVYAKKEVDTVSVGLDDHDPNLYAPLFKNVSVFESLGN